MQTYRVVVNGMIGKCHHRFHGGSGEAEIYSTEDRDAIAELEYSPYATRIVSPGDREKALAALMAMKWSEFQAFASKRGVKAGTREAMTAALMETLA